MAVRPWYDAQNDQMHYLMDMQRREFERSLQKQLGYPPNVWALDCEVKQKAPNPEITKATEKPADKKTILLLCDE